MSERIATARFRRSPAGAVALSVLAVGLGGWGIVNSPVFATRRIEVEGVKHLSPADVVEAAGVRDDQNLIRVSLDGVAERVQSLPWVRDAVAIRDLPSTLMVVVVERTPAAWFEDPAGMAIVARDGTVLDRPVEPPGRLPEVGLVPGPRPPGTPLPPDLRVVASMDPGLLAQIAAAVSEGGEVVLELRNGGAVRYGPPTELGPKNRALAEMLGWARREGVPVASIDLRIPGAPTLEPVSPPGGSGPSPSP